ncbi:DUF2813 domain-containing protein [uncultured Gammaproteobacteria bacterium]
MLKKLRIKGFKSILDAEVEFGRVNLFIGGNGSGKSNILEAIGMLSAALSRDITETELQRKGVRLSVPTLFKSSFKNVTFGKTLTLNAEMNNSIKYDVSLAASEENSTLIFFSEQVECGGNRVMGRSNNGISVVGLDTGKKDIDRTRGIWDRFREVASVPEVLEMELNRVREFNIYAPQTAFLRGEELESNPTKPLGLHGGGLPQAVHAVFSRRNRTKENKIAFDLSANIINLSWFPGWASKIMVGPAALDSVSGRVKTGDATLYFVDKFMREKRSHLSAYDSSEGTLYLLFVSVLLLHPEAPKIFALDNVDNALNPAITRKMLETLIEATCGAEYKKHNLGPDQVFLTSHNPTSLDAFDLFDDDQRVFVVSRSPDNGSTMITRLKPNEGWTRADWVKAAGGKNLSELWIEDKIPGALGL